MLSTRKRKGDDQKQKNEPMQNIAHDNLPSIDVLLQGSKSSNPVYFNWLSFCKEEDGDKAKEAMESHLTSFGVVSALMGTFFIAGIQAPPQRDGTDFEHKDWQMQLYVHMAGIAFLLNLFCVMLVVILYAYIGLYTGQEFPLFIYRYALISASLPPSLVALSAVVGMIAIILRIKLVYGEPAWMAITGISSFGTALLIFLFLHMELSTTYFRRSRNKKSTTESTAIISFHTEED
eukprot:gene5929-251_t